MKEKDQNVISTIQAAEIARDVLQSRTVNPETIRRWAKKHGLGFQIGGRRGDVKIYKDKLLAFLTNTEYNWGTHEKSN